MSRKKKTKKNIFDNLNGTIIHGGGFVMACLILWFLRAYFPHLVQEDYQAIFVMINGWGSAAFLAFLVAYHKTH